MKLIPDEIPNFLSRFGSFNDAIIRRWEIKKCESNIFFEIEIECREFLKNNLEWTNIKIIMSECDEFKYSRSIKINYDVLSNGLHIIFEDGKFGIEFGDFVDCPKSISDIRSSECFVISSIVEWNIFGIK